MTCGAKDNKYMPNSVVVGALVVGKEIGANGIENAFAEKENQREGFRIKSRRL